MVAAEETASVESVTSELPSCCEKWKTTHQVVQQMSAAESAWCERKAAPQSCPLTSAHAVMHVPYPIPTRMHKIIFLERKNGYYAGAH